MVCGTLGWENRLMASAIKLFSAGKWPTENCRWSRALMTDNSRAIAAMLPLAFPLSAMFRLATLSPRKQRPSASQAHRRTASNNLNSGKGRKSSEKLKPEVVSYFAEFALLLGKRQQTSVSIGTGKFDPRRRSPRGSAIFGEPKIIPQPRFPEDKSRDSGRNPRKSVVPIGTLFEEVEPVSLTTMV